MNIYHCTFLKRFKIKAIVLYPFVLYQDKVPDSDIVSHEIIHLDQIKRLGATKFYLRYLKEYAIGRKHGLSHDEAYRQISFEKEAYAHDSKNLAKLD